MRARLFFRQGQRMQQTLDKLKKALLSLLSRIWERVQREPVILKTTFIFLVSGGYLGFLSDAQLSTAEQAVGIAVVVLTALSLRGDVKPLPPKERTKLLRGEILGGKKDDSKG